MTEAPPAALEEKLDLEGLPKEQVVAMLNEKVKEITSLKGRNSKLEQKYINTFKEHKLYKKDHEVLTAFLKLVFSSMPEVVLGGLELKDLEVMWSTREAQFNEKMRKLMQELMEERRKEEAEAKREHQQRLSHMDQQSRSINSLLEKRLNETEVNCQNMAKEVVRLQNLLSAKSEQSKLLLNDKMRLEHELNSLKVDSVQNQLQSSFSAFNDTPRENTDRTELLMVKQQLQKMIDANDSLKETVAGLESKIRAKNRQIEQLKLNEEQQKTGMIPSPKSTMRPVSNGVAPPTKRKSQQQKKEQVEPPPPKVQEFLVDAPPQDRNKEYIEREYLKNVFLRFMKCLNDQNYPQAELLESVLMTILGLSHKERQAASFRRRQWWNIFT